MKNEVKKHCEKMLKRKVEIYVNMFNDWISNKNTNITIEQITENEADIISLALLLNGYSYKDKGYTNINEK